MTNTAAMPEHIRTILFNRVPEVTFAFWVIKILSTTTGETFADYLNDGLGLGLTITTWVMSALLAIALVAQFMTKRYNSGVYWTVVVLISIVGTLLTDNLTDVLGVELWVSTLIFSVGARRHVRHLVLPRAHALDPHDLHPAPRGLLLGRDPVHVRPGHRGGRPHLGGDGARATCSARSCSLRSSA